MNNNCLICGVGGQGTVLASKLIAQAAMNNGLTVKTAETIGMAQRGGSVVSHVRIGNNIHSPLIPFGKADVILGFEPAEAVRNLGYLKENGTVIVNDRAVKSFFSPNYSGDEMINYLRSKISNLIVVNGDYIIEQCGSARPLNVVMLGAACAANVLGISLDDVQNAMISQIKPQYIDINMKALEIGSKLVKQK